MHIQYVKKICQRWDYYKAHTSLNFLKQSLTLRLNQVCQSMGKYENMNVEYWWTDRRTKRKLKPFHHAGKGPNKIYYDID